MTNDIEDSPSANLPDEQPAGAEGTPKFGRLLVVLVIAVILMAVLTFASVEYYS